MSTQRYAMGTELRATGPYGLLHKGRVLCSDGRVRALKRVSPTADTYFSVPAAVKVKGRTVAGYVTVETVQGFSTPDDNDPAVVKFIAYSYRKNGGLLPALEKQEVVF